ncbi:hypothetical protein CTAYLR_004727 [Chrysophaeum taylorii]|uniref:P-loop containing nucleoside triphosphate hydrolase n=1 Tax=Chrysophaeum taylorii TaxID=2483200 RepID=A0AAD7U9M9_9STRA|nr:hypothetical protein CTAYLR_004727 [Chrysophaeum taylorii]
MRTKTTVVLGVDSLLGKTAERRAKPNLWDVSRSRRPAAESLSLAIAPKAPAPKAPAPKATVASFRGLLNVSRRRPLPKPVRKPESDEDGARLKPRVERRRESSDDEERPRKKEKKKKKKNLVRRDESLDEEEERHRKTKKKPVGRDESLDEEAERPRKTKKKPVRRDESLDEEAERPRKTKKKPVRRDESSDEDDAAARMPETGARRLRDASASPEDEFVAVRASVPAAQNVDDLDAFFDRDVTEEELRGFREKPKKRQRTVGPKKKDEASRAEMKTAKARRPREERAAKPSSSEDQEEDESGGDESEDEQDRPYPSFEESIFDDKSTTPLELADGVELPASISRYLPSYQREGVAWFYKQYASRQGGILADDMGLGKTLQTVAFVAALLGLKGLTRTDRTIRKARMARAKEIDRARTSRMASADDREDDVGTGPAFVLVPASTLDAWCATFETWTLCNVAALRSGSGQTPEERDTILRLARFGGYDVIVSSIDVALRLEFEQGPASYLVVIVDEVHQRFNKHNNKAYERIQPLKKRSKCMFGLTGTPLQNSAFEESHTLLSLCTDARLGSRKDYCQKYKPIEKVRARGRQDRETVLAGKARSEEFQQLIGTYLLRRTKEEVLGNVLTKGKNVHIVIMHLSPLQQELYKMVTEQADVKLLRKWDKRCTCVQGRRAGEKYKDCCGKVAIQQFRDVDLEAYGAMSLDERRRRGCFFTASAHDGAGIFKGKNCKTCPACSCLAMMEKLRKIACHPNLLQLDPADVGNEAKAKTTQLFGDLVFGEDEFSRRGLVRSNKFEDKSSTEECSKLHAVDMLLHQFKLDETKATTDGDDPGPAKVLIFSFWTQMLDVVEAFIKSKGYRAVRIDGKTPPKDRQSIMDDFNSNDDVYIALLSTGAGGTGINLQAANKVIIFDVHWNPVSDQQSQDRAYRIGQTRRVDVYRLVSQGTIEEIAFMRQIYKLKIIETGFEGSKGVEDGFKFYGVKGEYNGELFGNENLLQYSEESFIAKLKRKPKKKKKTKEGGSLGGLACEDASELIDNNNAADILKSIGIEATSNDDYMSKKMEIDEEEPGGDIKGDEDEEGARSPAVRSKPSVVADSPVRAPTTVDPRARSNEDDMDVGF